MKIKIKNLVKDLKRQKYLQAMAIPGIIWLLVFCYLPLYFLVIAFKDYNIVKPLMDAPWVGFKHFLEFFKDDSFWLIMKNTVGIGLLSLIFGFPLPILFAILLNEIKNVRFKKIVQTISYLPHFLSWIILGGIMLTWLADSGIITKILVEVGVLDKPLALLAVKKYFWPILIISGIWKELGWSAIIYLAAITGIDPELYEAATIDGAGRFRKIINITLPSIKGTVAVLFVLAASSILNTNFDQIMVLRNTLNHDVSDVLNVYIYTTGIRSARYSYSTAVGLITSLVSLGLLVLANFTTKKLTDSSLF